MFKDDDIAEVMAAEIGGFVPGATRVVVTEEDAVVKRAQVFRRTTTNEGTAGE